MGGGDIIRLNKTAKTTKAEAHARKGKLGSRPSQTKLPKIQRRKGAEVSRMRRSGGKVKCRALGQNVMSSNYSKQSLQTNDAERRAKDKTSKGEESKEREERGNQTHQPTHRPILRKYLIEPRYKFQENNSVHCGSTCT